MDRAHIARLDKLGVVSNKTQISSGGVYSLSPTIIEGDSHVKYFDNVVTDTSSNSDTY